MSTQSGVQNLVQGYFGMRTEQIGIQLPTFQLVDDLLCRLSYRHPKMQGNPATTFKIKTCFHLNEWGSTRCCMSIHKSQISSCKQVNSIKLFLCLNGCIAVNGDLCYRHLLNNQIRVNKLCSRYTIYLTVNKLLKQP